MSPSVVITGSTRGIGYALADSFLERGCQVTISGHNPPVLQDALAKLSAKYPGDLLFAYPCDVIEYSQVQALWDQARQHFGRVDIWINNAGIAAPMMDIWELPANQYLDVIHTNLIGTLNGTKVGLNGMLAQGFGALYNMEGFGARGNSMRGATLYGSTKASVHFIDQSLAREIKATPVIMGAIAPGMMVTDMVTRQLTGRPEELNRAKWIINIIAERPETVAPVLVEKILKNRKNGATIAFGSPARLLLRFILAPFQKRDLFSPE